MDGPAIQATADSRTRSLRLIRPSGAEVAGDFKWGRIKMEYRRSEKLERGGFTKLELLPLVESLPGRRVIAEGKKF